MHKCLIQVAAGDSAAFARLHCLVARRLAAFARRLGCPFDEVEEVVQEALIAIWRQAGRYDSTQSAPYTWMCMIVRSRLLDSYRKRKRDTLEDIDAPAGAEGAVDPAASPCEIIEQRQQMSRVAHAMGRIGREQRQVLELAYLSGQTQAEIGATLGKPLGTVKTLARRGLIGLREAMSHAAMG
jgi:RNA polymerase sigma-70 factor (ECF subfamily)